MKTKIRAVAPIIIKTRIRMRLLIKYERTCNWHFVYGLIYTYVNIKNQYKEYICGDVSKEHNFWHIYPHTTWPVCWLVGSHYFLPPVFPISKLLLFSLFLYKQMEKSLWLFAMELKYIKSVTWPRAFACLASHFFKMQWSCEFL